MYASAVSADRPVKGQLSLIVTVGCIVRVHAGQLVGLLVGAERCDHVCADVGIVSCV